MLVFICCVNSSMEKKSNLTNKFYVGRRLPNVRWGCRSAETINFAKERARAAEEKSKNLTEPLNRWPSTDIYEHVVKSLENRKKNLILLHLAVLFFSPFFCQVISIVILFRDVYMWNLFGEIEWVRFYSMAVSMVNCERQWLKTI